MNLIDRIRPWTAALLVTIACTATASDAERFDAVIDDHWAWSLSDDPILATRAGNAEHNDRLPSVAADALQQRLAELKAFSRRLADIDRGALPAADRISYDVLAWTLSDAVSAGDLGLERIPMNTFSGFYSEAYYASDGLRMASVGDYEDYVARLDEFPRYFAENIANLRRGMTDGFTLPKIVIEGIAPTVRRKCIPTRLTAASMNRSSPCPIRSRPRRAGGSPPKDGAPSKNRSIRPTRSFRVFLSGDYLEAATTGAGCGATLERRSLLRPSDSPLRHDRGRLAG